MSNLAQLLAHIKALKLSGIAESLELRLREAQSNDLSFSEFLAMILTDEFQVRANRKLQRLLLRAHAESSKTLESFDFGFAPGVKASQIRELSTCRFIEKGENIFFVGPTGTGKTHLAKALAHAACRQHLCVDFFNFQELFHTLKQADLANSLDRRMRVLKTTDLLVLDDFAFKKLDQQSAEYFYMIVDARYATKSIILTSNRAMSDWDAIFPDPIMANALMDRLAHNAHQIVIKGESYRKKLKPSQDRK
jgi:DNA replication protein DnaC